MRGRASRGTAGDKHLGDRSRGQRARRRRTKTSPPDRNVSGAGTIASIRASSLAGRTWIEDNLPPGVPRVADEALVGQRVVAGNVQRATAEGPEVQQRSQGPASSRGDE